MAPAEWNAERRENAYSAPDCHSGSSNDILGTSAARPGGGAIAQRLNDEAVKVIQSIAVGDTRALETLYDAYHPLVYGIARRILGDNEAAEAVVQSTFLAAWHLAPLFRSGHVGAWLARISRDASMAALARRDDTGHEAVDLEAALEGAGNEPYLGQLDGSMIRAALGALPPAERMVLELGFFERLGLIQLADKTGVAPGVVKSRIRSGLTRLRLTLRCG
jgi:RNA polymerase sigma-70 factor (ECF subfamily)